MIKFAEQKAAGRISHGAGIRYGRGRCGSILCNAASDTGANAYMIAVAPVTTFTSAVQLLYGPSASIPTAAARRIEITGTPLALVRESALGISRSSPSA